MVHTIHPYANKLEGSNAFENALRNGLELSDFLSPWTA
jgi:hypothetical protein